MANPFYTDTNATNALVGGQSATEAFGFPAPNAAAGLRAPSPRIQQAHEELRASQAALQTRLARPTQPKEPVIGYNQATDTLYSAGKEFDASNLSVMDAYDKAGYFDQDNTGKLPPGYVPYSPSQVRAWMQNEAANRGIGSRAAEIGKQALVGTGDIVQSGVNALGMLAPKDSWMERSINEAVSEYDRSNEGNTPDVYGATQVGTGFTKAARSIAPSVAIGMANPVAAAGLLAGMSGGTAYDTYQEGLRQGLSEDAAMAAARSTGLIEGAGEGVADRLGYGLLRNAGKAAAGLSIPTLKHGHKVATNLLANAALQAGTEFGQGYGQRAVEQNYGITGATPMEAGMEGFEQGLYMSALMSPFGIAAGYANRPRPAALPPQDAPPAPPTSTAVGFPSPPSGPFTPITPIDPTPETSFGGYNQPALPAPSAPMQQDPNAIVVTPGGTAAVPGTVNPFSGIQPDMFGGPDTFGQEPQAEVEQSAPTPDTQTADIFDGQIAAMVQTDFSPTQLMREIGRTRGARMLAKQLSAALGKPDQVEALLTEINTSGKLVLKNPQTKGRSTYELTDKSVEAANDIAARFQSRMTDALAQEGVARAQPGVTVGQVPGTESSAELMRQQSDAMLEAETTPDITRSTPNEMDVASLIKEKGPKGPASTLALRGQTQADLDELNAREQWTQGPTDAQPGTPAIPANQLALFNRKGQPTNPAMGVPLPKSNATDTTGQEAGKAAPAKPARVRTAKQAPAAAAETTAPVAVAKPETKTPTLEQDTGATQNVQEAPAEIKTRLLARLKRLDSKDVTLDMRDYDTIKAAIDSGDAQAATSKMAEIERDMREGRYRTVANKGGLTRKLLDIAIKKVEKALGGKIQIVVFDSVTEFDPKQTPGTRAGAYRDGKVYIFLDGNNTVLDATRTLFHELFHRGNALRHADKGYQQAMRKLYNQSAKVRAATNAWMKTDEGVKLQAQYPDADQYLAVAVDETLAETAEGLVEPGMVRTVGNWMANIADFFGMDQLAQRIRTMGQSQLEMFIRETMAYGRGESTAAGEVTPRFRTVAETWGKTTDAATRMQGWLQSDAVGKMRRGVLSSSFLTDLVDRFGDKLTALKRYAEKSHLMGEAAGKYQVAATAVQNEFQSIKDAKQRNQLNDFMARVTAANVSVEGDNKHLGEDQKVATELKAEFAAMTDQQKKAYRAARDTLRSNWKTRGRLLAKETDALFQPLIDDALAAGDYKKAQQLKREKQAFLSENQKVLSSLKGDYFPLMRFGRFRVVKKSDAFTKIEAERDAAFKELEALQAKLDTRTPEERKIFDANNKKRRAKGEKPLPEFTEEQQAAMAAAKKKVDDLETTLDTMKGGEKDYYMAQFETQAEAEADAKGIDGAYVSLVEDYHRELNPISRNMLKRMEESLAMTLKGSGNAASIIEAKKAMMEIYLSSLPDMSAMRRQAKRRNVAGFNKDMERSIAAAMLQDSFHLSRLEFMEDVKDAMLEIRREANASAREGEGINLQEVANEIERRFAADQRRVDTPVQDFLASMGWLYNLAVSPMYVITNLLQPFMISLPMISARHKYWNTSRAMGTAWADTWQLVKASAKKNWKGEIDFENSKLPEDEKAMLRKMLESQLLTVSLVSDLSAAADGKGLSKFTQLTALPAHHAEVINRIGTALAAYRLEKAASGQEKATEYAAKVLDQTHFNYSTENAPYWMKPGAGVVPAAKVVLQFRKYTVGMISLYVRTIAAAYKGADPQVRAEAKKTLRNMLITQQLVTGAVGLPGALSLSFVIKLIDSAFGDDEVEDPEVQLRNALTDMMGKEAATALMKGIPAMGDLDMSARLGLGNVLNPVPYMRDADTARSQYQELLLSLTGPTIGGVIPNFVDGFEHLANGNAVRAAESVIPKAARDLVKSYRFGEEGVTTRSGDTIRGPSDGWESFLTAMGLTPTDIADAYQANAAIQGRRSWYIDQRKALTTQWLKADDKTEAMQAVREYNEMARQANMKPITVADLQRARILQGKRNESYEKYGSNLPRREVGLAEEGRFLEKQKEE